MKIFLIALAFFLLGVGTFWGYNKYQNLLEENQKLKIVENKIPSSAVEEIPTLTPEIVEPTPTNLKGSITGKLGYPSEGIPELTVYAFDSFDQKKYLMIKTKVNQSEFTIPDVIPGTYYLVAYASAEYSGGYTKAVACGLSVECTDHSLIKVEVSPGKTASDVEIRDWYAPANTFPKMP